MRISDWSSDVCSSDLSSPQSGQLFRLALVVTKAMPLLGGLATADAWVVRPTSGLGGRRPLDLLETPVGAALVADHIVRLGFGVYSSEQHTSELQSLMRNPYAVLCSHKKH